MLGWKHKKNVQMEHTVTQTALHFAFYAQKVIGERSLSLAPSHPYGVIFIHKYWLSLKKIYYVVVCFNYLSSIMWLIMILHMSTTS